MNLIKILSCAILVASIIFVINIIKSKKDEPETSELARLKETPVTAGGAVIAYILSIILLIFQFVNPNISGASSTAHLYGFGLYVSCTLLGSYIILYTFVKEEIATKDKLIMVSVFNNTKIIKWDDVSKVESTFPKKLKISCKNGHKVTISGEKNEMKKLLKVAVKKIEPEIGEDILLASINKIK
ncbi:hypothetical protein LL033_23715 [Clostridium estertheticum]|uniref:hypothetical protein n=1 Tax=Clostridium estertheticum TaxID=238834 RepID=UPI001C0D025B|nr:hypothetical protein [Clostridium estertheticum]MBU3215159.1 hypothetical protein [Clostridium estertheticum]WAG55553.1 hypothetical protein LL033_23715 [Clostridium estertheticum]